MHNKLSAHLTESQGWNPKFQEILESGNSCWRLALELEDKVFCFTRIFFVQIWYPALLHCQQALFTDCSIPAATSSSGFVLDLDDKFRSNLFCRLYFPRSFSAFIRQFLEPVTRDWGSKTVVCIGSQNCLYHPWRRVGAGLCLWFLCLDKYCFPWLPPYILVQLPQSAKEKKCGEPWSKLTLSCSTTVASFFSLVWVFLCTCCGYGVWALRLPHRNFCHLAGSMVL